MNFFLAIALVATDLRWLELFNSGNLAAAREFWAQHMDKLYEQQNDWYRDHPPYEHSEIDI